MPLWMQYRFVRYFNSIPEYIYASDDEKQSIYNEIERSTKKILWVLSNDSVSKSIYRGYSSDRRSELVDAVKNTLKEENKVVKDIKKRSEQSINRVSSRRRITKFVKVILGMLTSSLMSTMRRIRTSERKISVYKMELTAFVVHTSISDSVCFRSNA